MCYNEQTRTNIVFVNEYSYYNFLYLINVKNTIIINISYLNITLNK